METGSTYTCRQVRNCDNCFTPNTHETFTIHHSSFYLHHSSFIHASQSRLNSPPCFHHLGFGICRTTRRRPNGKRVPVQRCALFAGAIVVLPFAMRVRVTSPRILPTRQSNTNGCSSQVLCYLLAARCSNWAWCTPLRAMQDLLPACTLCWSLLVCSSSGARNCTGCPSWRWYWPGWGHSSFQREAGSRSTRETCLNLIGALFWTFHVIVLGKYASKFESMSFSVGQLVVCGLLNLVSRYLCRKIHAVEFRLAGCNCIYGLFLARVVLYASDLGTATYTACRCRVDPKSRIRFCGAIGLVGCWMKNLLPFKFLAVFSSLLQFCFRNSRNGIYGVKLTQLT